MTRSASTSVHDLYSFVQPSDIRVIYCHQAKIAMSVPFFRCSSEKTVSMGIAAAQSPKVVHVSRIMVRHRLVLELHFEDGKWVRWYESQVHMFLRPHALCFQHQHHPETVCEFPLKTNGAREYQRINFPVNKSTGKIECMLTVVYPGGRRDTSRPRISPPE